MAELPLNLTGTQVSTRVCQRPFSQPLAQCSERAACAADLARKTIPRRPSGVVARKHKSRTRRLTVAPCFGAVRHAAARASACAL